MADLTNKDIDFLSKQERIDILRTILNEIDIVASSGAHRATTYLAASAIEGLFGELIDLLNIQPDSANFWPQNREETGPKKRDRLSFLDMEKILLAEKQALPSNFKELYRLVRRQRDKIHLKAELGVQLKNLIPIDQSVGQLALACLNALIEKYKDTRFLAAQQWKLMHGLGQVPEDNVVHMPDVSTDRVRASLLVSEQAAEHFREMKFRVSIPADAIFDFVYSFHSMDDWMAARIEGREGQNGSGYDSGRLHCTKWGAWHINSRYTRDSEPDPNLREHSVHIILKPKRDFALTVDGVELLLEGGVDWGFDPNGKVGFMTEHGVVSILDLEVDV